MKGSLLFAILFFAVQAYTQSITGTLHGRIVDAATNEGLVAATIQLSPGERVVVTSADGSYRFDSLAVGRYDVEVRYLGFESQRILGVVVGSGKDATLDIKLYAAAADVTPVVVEAPLIEPFPFLPTAKTLSLEAADRFPAAFNDPARLATNFAGVAGENDQSNALSVRGLPPSAISYRLQGVEIVNPNHLTGAGTRSDFGAPASGGVTMLSAQMLANSTFHNLQSPVGYNNNIGGVFDLRLRPGNYQRQEHTVQAGLIGLDVATEGPIKAGKISYLANYRYSTVGLLTDLGIDFGDEAISYQDAALHLSGRGEKLSWSVFGMWGDSRNLFKGPTADSLRLEEKDRYYEIDAAGKGYIVGGTIEKKLNTGLSIKLQGGYSTAKQQRSTSDVLLFISETINQNEELFSGRMSLTQQWSTLGLEAGVQTSYWRNMRQERTQFLPVKRGYYISTPAQISPYLSLRWQATKRLKIRLGSSYGLDKNIAATFWLPTLSTEVQLNQGWSAWGGVERRQAYMPFTSNAPGFFTAWLGSAGLKKQWSSNLTASITGYYENIPKAPLVLTSNERTFRQDWMNNIELQRLKDLYVDPSILLKSAGRSWGGILAINQPIKNGMFYNANLSLFQSSFSTSNSNLSFQPGRYDLGYSTNIVYGREINRKTEADKTRFFGYSGSLALRGGFRERPIDLEASRAERTTIFIEGSSFSERLPAYQRLDLRVYWKTEKAKSTHTLAVDIQNALNRGNIAYRQYDSIQDKIVDVEQLGIIPNISYRVHFR